MSEQDELVRVIESAGGFMFGEPFYDPAEVAEVLWAAGYRKVECGAHE